MNEFRWFSPIQLGAELENWVERFLISVFRRNSGVRPNIVAWEYAASCKDWRERIQLRTSTGSFPIHDNEHGKIRKSFWWPKMDAQLWIWLWILCGFSIGQLPSEACVVPLVYSSYPWLFIARQSGWEARDNQDENVDRDLVMIVSARQ